MTRKIFNYRKKLSPYWLSGVGVVPLDLELFNKIKDIFDSKHLDDIDIKIFVKEIRPFFEKKGFNSFFAIKESGDTKKITPWHKGSLMELYRLVYVISREFKDKKNSYSPMEICFLYYIKDIEKSIDMDMGIMHDIPYLYNFNKFLRGLADEIVFIVSYLKQLGFNSKPKDITFKEIILKYNNKPDKYKIILDDNLKSKTVQEYLSKKIDILLKELIESEEWEYYYPHGAPV